MTTMPSCLLSVLLAVLLDCLVVLVVVLQEVETSDTWKQEAPDNLEQDDVQGEHLNILLSHILKG